MTKRNGEFDPAVETQVQFDIREHYHNLQEDQVNTLDSNVNASGQLQIVSHYIYGLTQLKLYLIEKMINVLMLQDTRLDDQGF